MIKTFLKNIITLKPQEQVVIYGTQRLELALELRDNILPNIKYPFFIENGTLLGAWRNHKFIDHDDDFDYAILIEDEDKTAIIDVFNYIKTHINEKYDCRLISSYSDKIEIYDPEYGKYLLSEKYEGADYHYITIDLQIYKRINENKYQSLYYINKNNPIIDVRDILPLREIMLENNLFPAPFNTQKFLAKQYGSLDVKAKYNKETGKYQL